MPDILRFPYTVSDRDWGEASLMPYLPFKLATNHNSMSVSALVDSGAVISVLPYAIGFQLGLVWDEQETKVILSGNLASIEARGVALRAGIGDFAPVNLAFAWAKSDEFPIILGQTNFFMEFNVHFYRTQQTFEIEPKY